jgi:hypothetical protein
MLNYSRSGTTPNLLKLVICIVFVISCQIIDSVKSENNLLSDSLITGPVSSNGFNIILGTSDLAIGLNRFTFAIVSKDGLLDLPDVQVKTIFEGQVKEVTKAEYNKWPIPERGLYVTELNFDRSGNWDLSVEFIRNSVDTELVDIQLEVKDRFTAPANGELAFKSINKTLDDVDSFMELTTGSLNAPDFYRMTISEAISQGKPFVLVFSSPAFCTNAVCGPQLEVLHSLKTKHKDRYIFIHVDIYDNPEQVQSNFENAKISPVVKEWNLPTSLWTFIIGGKGQIKYRFEAFASESEIENALNQIY